MSHTQIPSARPNIGPEEIEAVTRVLESGMLAEGKIAREFENQFAKYVGTKFATVTTNGTTALSLALEAIGVQPGDEVITTPFTFIASANAISMIGAVPVFVDVDAETYNIDPNLIEKAITKKTRAILPVHIFGMPCDMRHIMEIAERHDLAVLEDAAQAHGAKVHGRLAGSFGHAAAFSFYATKNMMTGEGGMIVTNDENVYERVNMLKNHGRGKQGGYSHFCVGYNYRMMDIVAALGLVQLKRLPQAIAARRRNAKRYDEFFMQTGVARPQSEPSGFESCYHVYAPLLYSKNITRDQLIERLRQQGIGARTVYAIPCHRQETYLNIKKWRWARFVEYPDYGRVSLPVAEDIGQRHFEIPVHPLLTENEIDTILQALRSVLI